MSAGTVIGKASALLLALARASVGALGRQVEVRSETVSQIEDVCGEALALVADISDAVEMRDAVERLAGRWGRLDFVFANAGVNGVWAPLEELEPDEWDKTLDINLKGTFLTVKYAAPYLKK